jgi:hypothetical protein
MEELCMLGWKWRIYELLYFRNYMPARLKEGDPINGREGTTCCAGIVGSELP